MKTLMPSVLGGMNVGIPFVALMLMVTLRTPGFVCRPDGDIYWVPPLCMVGVVNIEFLPSGDNYFFCQVFNNMVLEVK